MNTQHKYRPSDKMGHLIHENPSVLMVMNRFGINFGFGDKSVKDVCAEQQVDYETFLAVVNFITEGQVSYNSEDDDFSLAELMRYLRNAHDYFIHFNLPLIREKLLSAIEGSVDKEVAYLVQNFYDDFVKEIKQHMEYENRNVFTYVDQLLQGKVSDTYKLSNFLVKHDRVENKLKELTNIITKYYPDNQDCNLIYSVLYDILNCVQDLTLHYKVENFLFVPAVARLERRLTHEK